MWSFRYFDSYWEAKHIEVVETADNKFQID